MSPADRFLDDGRTLATYAETEVLVVCPRCAERAAVRPSGAGRRLTCPHCALAREHDGRTSTWGRPVDPWFGATLWLQAEVRRHTVWAFDAAHLERIRANVAATHRERRPTRGAPRSMVEELPGWLTSAQHRDEVLAVLDRLAARATGARRTR